MCAGGCLSRRRLVCRRWRRDADAFKRTAAALRKRVPRTTPCARPRTRKWSQCCFGRESGCARLRNAANRKLRRGIYAARHSGAAFRNRGYLETLDGETRPRHKNKYCTARADGYLCVEPWMRAITRPPLCVGACIWNSRALRGASEVGCMSTLHYARALALNAQMPRVSNCVWMWARPVGLQPLSVISCIWNPWMQNPAQKLSQLFILR